MGPGAALLFECLLLPGLQITVACWPPVVSSTLGVPVALPVCPREWRHVIYKAWVTDYEATAPTPGSAAGLSFLMCE